MNRVGMIVDVTHLGVRSSLEAMELTAKPPVFSHSTPRKFAAHDRNITDEQIRACASRGGVVCLAGLGIFMDAHFKRATAGRFAETIDHVVQLVGPRHAGVGLDYVRDPQSMLRYLRSNSALYGGGSQYPADGPLEFLPPEALPAVVDALTLRGYSDGDVRGILGENYLRVLDANWSDP
jgi:membrane dipeptidase